MNESMILTAHYEGKGYQKKLVFRDDNYLSIIRIPLYGNPKHMLSSGDKKMGGALVRLHGSDHLILKKFGYPKHKCTVVNYPIDECSRWQALVRTTGFCQWKLLDLKKLHRGE